MDIGRSAPAGHGGIGADTEEDALYRRVYPYHAEVSALSEIRKKPGAGVPLHSGMGGHSLLYLNGVCLDRQERYPMLRLCDPDASPADHGVGISVNAHYRNANWIAAEGRDFLWRGALEQGEGLTREGYERTQDRAKAMGLLDGIVFHDHLFRDKPPGMSERDYMYEISVATDYAARFGRDVYRVRVPLDRTRMAAIVTFLNDINAPYREGRKMFRWRVLNNNCSHLVHNALASAGVWPPWPTGQFFATAAFRFPVPKNEFVDLVLRTNDLPVQDPLRLHEDAAARRALLETGSLPTAPGALVTAERAIQGDEIFDTQHLRLIFYDNPFWGPYRGRFARILSEPRYSSLRANLCHFDAVYAAALECLRSARGLAVGFNMEAGFQMCYDRHIKREAEKVKHLLSSLDRGADLRAETVS